MPDTLSIPFLDTLAAPADTSAPSALPALDSIYAAYRDHTPAPRPTLFSHHQLQSPLATHPRATYGPADWVFLALLLCTAAATLIATNSRLKLNQIAQSAVDNRSLGRLVRENASKHYRMLVPMSLVYLSALALPLSLQLPRPTLPTYLLCAAGAMAYYFLRNGIAQLMGTIFENGDATRLYIANTYIYSTLGAVLLPPLLIIALFSHATATLLPACLILAAALLLARLIRGLTLVFSSAKNSRFYLFYYLCTLEVVPPLILLKLLIL